MPFKKIGSILAIVFIFTLSLAPSAQAGFGVTSPYIENDLLVPGAHYQKKIILVRGDPVEDWEAEMTIDVSGASDWFSIDKGNKFILPVGQKQFPIIISVDVPSDAKLNRYQGAIHIRTMPVKTETTGVSIALGARINVDIKVVEGGIFDFIVQNVRLFEIEEGWKIKLGIEIENTGNVAASPSKIYLDVYDAKDQNKLVSLENNGLTEKVKPFEHKELIAEFPNQLKVGLYLIRFKIFNGENVSKEGKLNLGILPPGTLPSQNQSIGALIESLMNSKFSPIFILIIVVILIIVFFIILKIIKKKRS